ncbi:3387_t:CDS:2, partial [Ambispora leptoticha]
DINTIDEAKEYSNYYGVLKPEEKSIFDSNLLKPNGTLDKTLLQDIAHSESHNLLASILKEQKAESISYQVVNNLNNNKSVDKIVSQFEDILFSEFDPEFDQKIEDLRRTFEKRRRNN